jgi:hypothetical protein
MNHGRDADCADWDADCADWDADCADWDADCADWDAGLFFSSPPRQMLM